MGVRRKIVTRARVGIQAVDFSGFYCRILRFACAASKRIAGALSWFSAGQKVRPDVGQLGLVAVEQHGQGLLGALPYLVLAGMTTFYG
jgi:hypothetical protein